MREERAETWVDYRNSRQWHYNLSGRHITSHHHNNQFFIGRRRLRHNNQDEEIATHQKVAAFTPSISQYIILQNQIIFVTKCTYVYTIVIFKCRCTPCSFGVPYLIHHLVRCHISRCMLYISMLQVYCLFYTHVHTCVMSNTSKCLV